MKYLFLFLLLSMPTLAKEPAQFKSKNPNIKSPIPNMLSQAPLLEKLQGTTWVCHEPYYGIWDKSIITSRVLQFNSLETFDVTQIVHNDLSHKETKSVTFSIQRIDNVTPFGILFISIIDNKIFKENDSFELVSPTILKWGDLFYFQLQ